MAPRHGATPAWTYYGSPVKLEEYGNAGRCNRLWEELEMGLQRKIGGDLNLGAAAIPERGPWGSGRGWDNAALECSLLLHGLGSRRDFAWKKRSERILAGGL